MRTDSVANVAELGDAFSTAKSQGNPYRLAVVAASFPQNDGLANAEDILKASGGQAPVILLVTPTDRQRFAQQLSHLDFANVLDKPVSRLELRDALVRAVRHIPPDRKPVQPAAPYVAPLGVATGRRLNVLLAEDTPANQKLITHILRKRGHNVAVANNGREAVELAAQETFDLILMDVQMPIVDGFQATSEIRASADSRSARLPIIAMTAHAMQGDRERCLAAGMDEYITKPIDMRRLIQLVEACGVDEVRAVN